MEASSIFVVGFSAIADFDDCLLLLAM